MVLRAAVPTEFQRTSGAGMRGTGRGARQRRERAVLESRGMEAHRIRLSTAARLEWRSSLVVGHRRGGGIQLTAWIGVWRQGGPRGGAGGDGLGRRWLVAGGGIGRLERIAPGRRMGPS
jgi:hypothetical protein